MVDWKIFNRLSILPLFETITRNGAGACLCLILAFCKSSGMPSRTLSRFKLVCPSKTASAKARWRNKCSLSSREVKSTGANVRVVTLPSAVMANVATTSGLLCRESCRLPDLLVVTLAAPITVLLRLRDFMFGGRHFAFHFAELHAFGDAARSIEEVNDPAGH